MRILLLTQVAPYPPDSGPKIKTLNVLRYLARRHELHLITFVRSPEEEAQAQNLHRFCASITCVPLHRSLADDLTYLARSLVRGRPFLIERDDRPEMWSAVRDLLQRHPFDAVHADQLSMAQYAVDLPVPLRILDEHNAVWTIVRRSSAQQGWGPQRLPAELEWRKIRRYEGDVCRRFDWVTVVSDADRVDLEAAAGGAFHSSVIPITMDTEQLAYQPRAEEARHVLSVATMFYPPNVEGVYWFAREVFPRVRARLPGTDFLIVGSRPPAEITQLEVPESGIHVTGYVEDLSLILRQSGVLIVPLHSGSGMRVKILEAFARGIPVVSTRIGVEGIDAHHDEHLLVADEPEELAAQVIRLLCEPETAARLARAGRRLVEERYEWRSALAGLDTVFTGIR